MHWEQVYRKQLLRLVGSLLLQAVQEVGTYPQFRCKRQIDLRPDVF